jgi:hypothetical protein
MDRGFRPLKLVWIQMEGIPSKWCDCKVFAQMTSSFVLMIKVDWSSLFKSFYDKLRDKLACRNPEKIPLERLFELDKKLYMVNILVEGLEHKEGGNSDKDDDDQGDDGDNGTNEDINDDNFDDLDDQQDSMETYKGNSSARFATPTEKYQRQGGTRTVSLDQLGDKGDNYQSPDIITKLHQNEATEMDQKTPIDAEVCLGQSKEAKAELREIVLDNGLDIFQSPDSITKLYQDKVIEMNQKTPTDVAVCLEQSKETNAELRNLVLDRGLESRDKDDNDSNQTLRWKDFLGVEETIQGESDVGLLMAMEVLDEEMEDVGGEVEDLVVLDLQTVEKLETTRTNQPRMGACENKRRSKEETWGPVLVERQRRK